MLESDHMKMCPSLLEACKEERRTTHVYTSVTAKPLLMSEYGPKVKLIRVTA